MTKTSVLVLVAALAVAEALASCSDVPNDARIGIDAPPGPAAFNAVGDYFAIRCGSLDCHGQTGRNMRIWGEWGMRLDPKDISGGTFLLAGQVPTTDAEYEATYRSVVGLEPTVMSTVVAGHGAHPELLTFVRKARGLEAHKGGTLITPGDDQDICITSWLASNVNTMECQVAAGYPRFPLDASIE